jgi:hypothetical protein
LLRIIGKKEENVDLFEIVFEIVLPGEFTFLQFYPSDCPRREFTKILISDGLRNRKMGITFKKGGFKEAAF